MGRIPSAQFPFLRARPTPGPASRAHPVPAVGSSLGGWIPSARAPRLLSLACGPAEVVVPDPVSFSAKLAPRPPFPHRRAPSDKIASGPDSSRGRRLLEALTAPDSFKRFRIQIRRRYPVFFARSFRTPLNPAAISPPQPTPGPINRTPGIASTPFPQICHPPRPKSPSAAAI